MYEDALVVKADRSEARHNIGNLLLDRAKSDDPDKDVRKAAISALEELGGDASTELLRVGLSDRDAAVRTAAAEALADFSTAR